MITTKLFTEQTKNDGTKDYYCTVTAYDSARKLPADPNDKGNSVTYFYLYKDIYESLLSQYKVTELYQMLSGAYEVTDSNKQAVNNALSVLAAAESKVSNASFSLNPLNNPTYEVSGINTISDILKAENKWNEEGNKLLNNSKLSVSFKTGLDNAVLNSESIAIYLKECDENGVPKFGNPDEVDLENDIVLKKAGEGEMTTVGTGYSTVVTVGTKTSYFNANGDPVSLNLGSYYRFFITGKDANGKPFISGESFNSYDYGFKLNSSGSVPIMRLTAFLNSKSDENQKPVSFDISSGDKVVLVGTVEVEEGEIDISAILQGPHEDDVIVYEAGTGDRKISVTEKSKTPSKIVYEVSLEVPHADFISGQNTINFTANKKQETQKTEQTFTINLDGEKPTVKDITVEGFEFDPEREYNGIVLIKAYAEDNETVSKIDYEITDTAGTVYKNPHVGTDAQVSPAELRTKGFRVDTRDYDNASGTGNITINIFATDKAGNKSDAASITLKVNQETDKPVFSSTVPFDIEHVSEDDIGTGTNAINLFTNNKDSLKFSVSDDDGLDSVIVYKVKGSNKYKLYERTGLSGASKHDVELKINVSATEKENEISKGLNTVQIFAKDSALNVTNETSEIKIFIDDNPLSLSLASYNEIARGIGDEIASGTKFNENSDFTFYVVVQENDKNLTDLVYSDNDGTPVSIKDQVNLSSSASQLVKVTIPKPAVSKRIVRKYTATNKYKRSKSVILELNFDLDNPVLTTPKVEYTTTSFKSHDYAGRIVYNANTAFTIKVNATDVGTGLDTIQYAIIKGIQSSWNEAWNAGGDAVHQTWIDLDKKQSEYQAKISSDMVSEGDYTVFLRAIDNVGNESTYKNIQIGCDKNNPLFTTDSDLAKYYKTDVEISGTLTETYLASDALGFTAKLEKKNGQNWGSATNFTVNTKPSAGTEKPWKVTVNKNSGSTKNDGYYRLILSAKDQVGVTKEWISSEFYIDTTVPALSVPRVNYTAIENVNADYSGKFAYNANNPLTLTVTSSDSLSGLDAVEYAVIKGTQSEWSSSWADGNSAVQKWWTSLELKDGKYQARITSDMVDEADYTIFIKATDKAGNTSTIQRVQFTCDKNAPVITGAAPEKYYNAAYFTTADKTVDISGTLTEKFLKPGTFKVILEKDGVDVSANASICSISTATVSAAAGTYSWNAKVKKSDGNYVLKVQAMDAVGISGTLERSFCIDTVASTISSLKFAAGSNDAAVYTEPFVYNGNKALSVTSVITDVTSGIRKAEYAVVNGNYSAWGSGTAWAKGGSAIKQWWTDLDNQTSDYLAKITSDMVDEGPYTVFIRATDNAGNESGTQAVQFTSDKTAPAFLECTSPSTYNKTSVVLSGKLTETYLAANGFSATLEKYNGSDWITAAASLFTVNTTPQSGSKQPWQVTVNNTADGLYRLTVSAVDKAGVTGTWTSDQFHIDTTAPSLNTLTYAVASGSAAAYAGRFVYNANNSLTLNIKASDAQTGVNAVQYAIIKGTQESWSSAWAEGGDSVQQWWTDLVREGELYQAKIASYLVDEGEYTVFIKAIDNVKLESDYSIVQIGCDKNNPLFTGSTPVENTKENVVLTGTLTEPYLKAAGFAARLEKYNGSAWVSASNFTVNTTPVAGIDKAWKVTVSNSSDGLYRLVLTATDQVGKTNTWTSSNFRIDTTAPVLSTANDAFNLDGKTYSQLSNAWFNSSSLKLSGRYTENGSGIENVKVYVTPAGESDSSVPTVEATAKPGSGYYSFSSQLEGLKESSDSAHNKVRIETTDIAGNNSVTTVLSLKVDLNPPEIGNSEFAANVDGENLSQGGNKLVNGTKDITIKVPATDAISGIKSDATGKYITLAFGNKVFDATGVTRIARLNEISGLYEFTIVKTSADKVLFEKGAVYARAVDNAGNSSDMLLFRFNFDNTAPTVEFTSHENNSTVNKTITLKGTTRDDQKLDTTVLSVSTNNGSTWTVIGDTSLAEPTLSLAGSVWEKEIDTTAYSDGNIKFKIAATDSAANPSETVLSLKIDQNTDRPVISITDFDGVNGTYLKDTARISGNISDDDGTIKVFKYSTTAITTAAGWTSGGVSVVPSNGAFTFTVSNPLEAKNSLYFYVEDRNGGKFWTGNTAQVTRPYLSFDAGETTIDNTSAVTYTFDKTNPYIGAMTYAYGPDENNTGDCTALKTTTGENLLGGSLRSSVVFKVNVYDSNGVKSVSGTYGEDKDSLGFTLADSRTLTVSESFTLEDGTVKTIPAGGKIDTYVSESFDVTSKVSGTLSLTVKDNSGKDSSATRPLTIDNLKPNVNLTSPDESAVKTGSFTIAGSYTDEGEAGIAEFKYLVINNAYYTDSKISEAKVRSAFTGSVPAGGNSPVTYAKPAEGYGSSWTATLTGLPASNEALLNYSKLTKANNIYTLPVYFYIKDTVGNERIVYSYIQYSPFGSMPSAKVSYPEGTFTEAAQMNGAVRLSGSAAKGTADGAENLDKVYLQFDVNNDGIFDSTDRDILKKVYTGSAGLDYNLTVLEENDLPYYGSMTAAQKASALSGLNGNFWGVGVNGAANWYLSINANMEFQNTFTDLHTKDSSKEEGAQFKVGVRAVAVTAQGTFGQWSDPQYIVLDTNIPSIGDKTESIVEVDGEGNVVSTRTYEQDMFLKGTNQLRVSVSDAEGIAKVMVYESDTKAGLNKTGAVVTTLSSSQLINMDSEWASENRKGYVTKYDLNGKLGSNRWYKVVAYKENDTSAYAVYNVNFDNTAPEINDMLLNSVSYEDSDKKIVNSNGTFTISGKMTDDGSGFERAAFYFVRGDAENYERRIYDPMSDSSKISVQAKGSSSLASGMSAMQADGTVITDSTSNKLTSENPAMFGNRQNVTVSNSGLTVTLSAANANIKAGGLIYISGTYIRIAGKTGNTLTLDKPTTASGTVSAFFPFMQVVDNTGAEKTDETGLTVTSGDDGDGMPESIIKSQTKWTWDATLQSQNIPDGPGKLVIFIWDKAGNVSAQTYDVSVQNKAPRLVQLHLGTDLDGSGKYSDNEFVSYDVLEKTGEKRSYKNMETSEYRGKSFRVKDKLAVVPEFVGGNILAGSKDIKMVLNSAAEDDDAFKSSTENLIASNMAKLSADSTLEANRGSTKVDGVLTRNNIWCYEIPNAQLGDESTSAELEAGIGQRAMSFTFWDSTEDTTQGIDSCYCFLRITDFIVDTIDTDNPVVTLDEFYWNSKEDSSVPTDENDNVLGHIDLKEDIVNGVRPAVSGQVYIRGKAYDNTKLGKLYVTEPDGTEYQVASYDGTWTEVKDGWPSNFKSFEITKDSGITQDGHEIEFCFAIDMTPYGVSTNRVTSVRAEDAQNNTDAGAGYAMDFVPYIKGIRDTTRSRLGRYPVRVGQKVVLEGMNFASGASYTVSFYKTNNGKQAATANGSLGTQSGTIGTTPGSGEGYITITVPAYSCFVQVEITQGTGAAKVTLNNTNANERYNIVKGNWKNGDPLNGSDYWTDDVYLSVWNVAESSLFAGSINPHSGVIKKVDKYNSGSGAPTNIDGSVAAPAPGGGYIYKQPEDKTEVTPETNMNDSYYGAISSDDLKLYGYVSGRTYDSHGDNIAFNSSEVAYVAPVDEMDYTIVNGTPYYVMQDNGLGGDSGSVWGLGLCMVREGIWYDRGYFNPYKGNTIEENKVPFIIEKQGSNVASHKRDSSTGYDSVLYQFKNPRITGWYNANDSLLYSKENGNKSVKGVDYIYISYYDSYAKCLKYAAYRVGHRFASNDHKYANSYLKDWGKIDMPKDIDIVAEMTTSPMTTQNQTEQKAYNHLTDGAAVVAGNETTSNNPVYTEIAGEWSDIFVDTTGSEPRPVIIYYNKTAKSLEVAYGNNSFPQETAEWTKSTEIRPNGVTADFGRYVSAAMDKKGNLHVAAQDADNAKLYYLYLTKSGSTYSVANSVAVDASSGAGRWTDIELTNPEGTTLKAMKPVISYIDTGFMGTSKGIKVAYLDDVTAAGKPVFEAMTDPAYYISTDQRTSVMSHVKETKGGSTYASVAVGFNSDMLALDFLRDEE